MTEATNEAEELDEGDDVAVVGSGAAGLSAALAAAAAGARVVVLEAADRALGDPAAAHPNLGTVSEPPFFALPIRAGTVGTKGGPCTDMRGQVLRWDHTPIPGLFAAGNVADSVIGPGILSPGMTIGLALTWGRLAGAAAAAGDGTAI